MDTRRVRGAGDRTNNRSVLSVRPGGRTDAATPLHGCDNGGRTDAATVAARMRQ